MNPNQRYLHIHVYHPTIYNSQDMEQAGHPSAGKWTWKENVSHCIKQSQGRMERQFAEKQVALEITTLRERSQTQRHQHRVLSRMWSTGCMRSYGSSTRFSLYFKHTEIFFLKIGSPMYSWLTWNVLRRPGQPLAHKDLPASATQVLGLKACVTVLNPISCSFTPVKQFVECDEQAKGTVFGRRGTEGDLQD